jgi:integrase
MLEMPRPRPPHLQRQVSRHGTVSWVVRIGRGSRIYLRAPYGTPEFEAEYYAAVRGDAPRPRRGKGAEGTLGWLVARWQTSSDWATLAPATQRQRINILKHALADAEHFPFREIGEAEIIAGRERRASTPSQANNFLNTMRSLFKWAAANDFLESDPTDGVKNVKRPNTGGFHSWTEAEVEQFERRWPIGTRERLAFSILLYTGLRRGDAARLGRQHVSNGMIYMRAEKTDAQITIPVLLELQRILDASRTAT